MAFSTYLANDVLDDKFAGTIYLALFTTNPTASGSGTEASGGSYARQSFTVTSATGGTVSNVADIVFTANTATYTHYAIFDAVTAGNMLDYGTLNGATGIIVTEDDTEITFSAGDVDISITTSI